MRRIVIPGGSGQVGQMLAGYFHSQGDAVTVLARQAAERPWRTAIWNGRDLDASWAREIEAADVVINLAGRSVNCRYNDANRREIMNSRVHTTRLVGRAIAECANPPALWMNASTATIYRHALDRAMDEATGEIGGREPGLPSTWKFSIDVATSWEGAFFAVETPRTRKIALRSAMVMWPSRGGIFATLLRLVRTGLGGSAGDGNQFISWIHGDDFIRALEFLIAHPELDSIVNVSTPNPLPQRDFMRELRRAAGVPIGLPATKWMLEVGAIFLRTRQS
ncbi:MAG TPA: NAD-dependent epimerase/dehydratase family protein [Terriglobales bacterium]|nr:NAD-dependent epimerase/dehydratase family protein [Terriglobales bacterium]